MNDPIADLLIRIKNGYMAKKREVVLPWSKILENIAEIFKKQGYLEEVKVEKDQFRTLILSLKYIGKKPALTSIKRISKPGVRRYIKAKNIKPVLNGFGTMIVSTPDGLMTGRKAKEKSLGGEVICEVW